MRKEIKKNIILWWLLATISGLILGAIISSFNVLGSYYFWAIELNLIWVSWAVDALITGMSIGFMQWLIVKKFFDNSWLWVLSMAAAQLIVLFAFLMLNIVITGKVNGIWLTPIIGNFIRWFFIGTSAGIFQFLIIKKQVNYAWVWIPTSSIAWMFGGAVMRIINADVFSFGTGYPIGGLITGIPTGIIFYLILSRTIEMS